MNVALDIGSYELRALWYDAGRLQSRRCRSVYLVIEDTEVHRGLLSQLRAPFSVAGDQLALFGEPAQQIATILRRPCRPLLPAGRLPDNDPATRQILATVFESLIGQATRLRSFCAVILPGVTKSGSSLEAEEKRFLLQTVKQLGYIPLNVSAPQCLVLAELASQRFTGIGASFGAATAEMSLLNNGREIARCAVPYAGSWIDHKLTRLDGQFVWDPDGNRFVDTDRTRRWKETLAESLSSPIDDAASRLADVCRGMIEHVLEQAATPFAEAVNAEDMNRPLPLVVGGGTTRLPGFRELLEDTLSTSRFPLEIENVRLSSESDFTFARGGLIQAELESTSLGHPTDIDGARPVAA